MPVSSSDAACASGSQALQSGRANILAGFRDVALVVGADTTPKGFFAPVGGERRNDPDWQRFHLIGSPPLGSARGRPVRVLVLRRPRPPQRARALRPYPSRGRNHPARPRAGAAGLAVAASSPRHHGLLSGLRCPVHVRRSSAALTGRRRPRDTVAAAGQHRPRARIRMPAVCFHSVEASQRDPASAAIRWRSARHTVRHSRCQQGAPAPRPARRRHRGVARRCPADGRG